jgi:hypothetical protein
MAVFLLFFASLLSRVLLFFLVFLSGEIQGMNMPNLLEVSRLEDLLVHGCIRCTCIAEMDALLMKIVVAEGVLL